MFLPFSLTGFPNFLGKRTLLPVIILFILGFGVCGTLNAEERVKFLKEFKTALEMPVDVAVANSGDVYILDKKQSTVFVYGPNGEIKVNFGDPGNEEGQLEKPEAMAISPSGEIIVADTGNKRIQVFDLEGNFKFSFGSAGVNPGQFKQPNSIAIDPMGYIFVTDYLNKTISKFTPKGVFLEAQLLYDKPDDIYFDVQNNMYVLFKETGKILKYSPRYDHIREISLGEENNDLFNTISVAVDKKGDIYIIENLTNRVKKFDQREDLLFAFGSKGVGKGQFDAPANILTNKQNHIFIADTNNQRVQMFQITGSAKADLQPIPTSPLELEFINALFSGTNIVDLQFVPEKGLFALSEMTGDVMFTDSSKQPLEKLQENFGELKNPKSLFVSEKGEIILTDTGNNRLSFRNTKDKNSYHFGSKGKESSKFNGLEGVAISHDDYIFVSDTNNHRIQVFNKDGIYLNSFGKMTEGKVGAEVGSFLYPKDIVFNSLNHLYVLDSQNRRIQIFDKNGNFIKEIGADSGKIQFVDPVDIALDEHNYLYVADRGQHRVFIFDPKADLVMEFGSQALGPAYFPRLSAIESYGGKIFVADVQRDQISVFDYQPIDKVEEEREYETHVSQPLRMDSASEEIKVSMARKLLFEKLRKDLAEKWGVREETLDNIFRVEAEKLLQDGRLQLTVSYPKIMPENLSYLNK